MKTLLFFRHGKSDWDADYGPDHDRPLARRGRKAAKKMGRYLKSIDEVPDVVITSTAVRARTTAQLANEAGKWSVEVEDNRDLYDASPSSVLDLVHELDDNVASVMLVGHEPTWSASIQILSAGPGVQFPTAAMASIQFDVDKWSDVQPAGGRLNWLVIPRSLPDDH